MNREELKRELKRVKQLVKNRDKKIQTLEAANKELSYKVFDLQKEIEIAENKYNSLSKEMSLGI